MKPANLSFLLIILSLLTYSCNKQEKLADIAYNDNDSIARIEAVRKIDDQEILAGLAINASHGLVRAEAVKKLNTDKWRYLINDIIKNNDEFLYIRSIAENKLIECINQMDDKEELRRIAENNENTHISEAAKIRLDHLE